VSTAVADDLAHQAGALLDLWSQLSAHHVVLGAGCACGVGGVSLRLEDFELDIVGYLEDAGLRCEVVAVVGFFQALQAAPQPSQPLLALLHDMQQERLPGEVTAWLLPRLERTLRSFAELHGPKGQG
jgi:hypothetical protein